LKENAGVLNALLGAADPLSHCGFGHKKRFGNFRRGQSTHGPGKRALHAAFEAGQGEPRLTCQHIDAIAHVAAWNSAKP
jgi:hypothetical protein